MKITVTQMIGIQIKRTISILLNVAMMLVLHSLPLQFRPMVLLHRDFSTANLIVDKASCHLVGVFWLGWGSNLAQNLHFVQNLTCYLHMDYRTLQETFWSTFQDKVGRLSRNILTSIKIASIMGLLLYRGFARRLAGMPQTTTTSDDEAGRYGIVFGRFYYQSGHGDS